MSSIDTTYDSAQAWFDAAMERGTSLDPELIRQRQAIADAHNACNDIRDAVLLADQQLYIQGYMELEEYQRFLLLRHGKS